MRGGAFSPRRFGQCASYKNGGALHFVPVVGEDQQFIGAGADDH